MIYGHTHTWSVSFYRQLRSRIYIVLNFCMHIVIKFTLQLMIIYVICLLRLLSSNRFRHLRTIPTKIIFTLYHENMRNSKLK